MNRISLSAFGAAVFVLSGVASLYAYLFCGGHLGNVAPSAFLNGLMYQDAFTLSLTLVILLGTGVTLMMNSDLLGDQQVKKSVDIDALVLLSACGAMVMVSAANMMVLFLGFELLSVAVYVLTGTARNEKASSEGALKYFILGAFSSAFLLYGMVLVYGVTGSMNLFEIGQLASANAENPLLLVAIGLIIFGFAFKVSLVPFHFWTPDVYQGAPTTLATFMAVVVKAAAFGSFLRVMSYGFGDLHTVWQGMLWGPLVCR
jgi:NADH-quinone oxidoreductase subunit N